MANVSDLGEVVSVGSIAILVPSGTTLQLVNHGVGLSSIKPDDLANVNPNLIGKLVSLGVRPEDFGHTYHRKTARKIFETGSIVPYHAGYAPIL